MLRPQWKEDPNGQPGNGGERDSVWRTQSMTPDIAAESEVLGESSFSLKPLMFETFVCSMAMMAFVSLAGPIARVIGLAPWQVGAAMTVAGVAWMV
ncbi:MAG: hypothetical protein AB7E60_15765, partial [Sphingobium sp.]